MTTRVSIRICTVYYRVSPYFRLQCHWNALNWLARNSCAGTTEMSQGHQTILQPALIIGTSISGWRVNWSGYARLTTRPKGHHFRSRVEFQADNAQLVHSTGANVSVMLLQDLKSSPQNNRPFESGHRRHCVWLAIGYSYKLGQKMKLNFSAN